jgi:coenzyme PQQ precursor peptide PqqA
MSAWIHRWSCAPKMGWYCSRGLAMKWETPQAVELRFGMEITMYVANR